MCRMSENPYVDHPESGLLLENYFSVYTVEAQNHSDAQANQRTKEKLRCNDLGLIFSIFDR